MSLCIYLKLAFYTQIGLKYLQFCATCVWVRLSVCATQNQQIAKMVFSNKYNPVIYTGSGSQNSFSRRYSIGVLKFSTILTLFYLSPVISTCIYGTHRLRSKLLILRFYATLLVVYQVIDNMLILQFYATHKKMRKETKFHNAISRADLQKL